MVGHRWKSFRICIWSFNDAILYCYRYCSRKEKVQVKSIFWQSNVSLYLGHIFGVMQTMTALKIYEFSTTPPPVTSIKPAFWSLLPHRQYIIWNFIKLKMKASFCNFVCDSHYLRMFYMHTYTNTHIHYKVKLVVFSDLVVLPPKRGHEQ